MSNQIERVRDRVTRDSRRHKDRMKTKSIRDTGSGISGTKIIRLLRSGTRLRIEFSEGNVQSEVGTNQMFI